MSKNCLYFGIQLKLIKTYESVPKNKKRCHLTNISSTQGRLSLRFTFQNFPIQVVVSLILCPYKMSLLYCLFVL